MIDNVSRILVDEIRNFADAMTVSIYVVDATASPVSLEASYSGFSLKNLTYDALSITGRLTVEDFLGEPFPKGRTPSS